MTRVLVLAQSPLARAGMKALLEQASAELTISGSTASLADAVAQVSSGLADVIVAEIDEWDDKAWSAWEEFPAPLVALADLDPDEWVEALRVGIRAILPRDASAEQVASAVVAARQGLVVVNFADLDPLLSANGRASAGWSPGDVITPREREVLRLVADGLGNKQVAGALHISEHTVKFHITSIMSKLNAGTRTEAVAMAIRRGLIPV